MPIFSSRDGHEPPKRKPKPKPNPWDTNADFLALKAAVSGGKMKPNEQVWMYIEEHVWRKRYNQKFPARSATDSMRRFIKELGLASDYYAEKYETGMPGQWMLMVTYDPPQKKEKG